MPDPTLMQQRLTPTHLQPATVEDAKEAVEAVAAQAKVSPEDAKRKKMQEKKYPFAFDFTATNGKKYEGSFTSVIPDMKTRGSIGIYRSQLAGGMPFSSIDPVTSERFFVLAHLTFMLESATLPEWAKNLEAIDDPEVLFALWSEVQAHETTFLGRR